MQSRVIEVYDLTRTILLFVFPQSHVGTCLMEPVYCDNKCGQKVSRKGMIQHKAVECSKRMTSCRHCAKEFAHDTLAAHHAKCGRLPIQCPNQCDSPKVAREELESHLKDNCPALMVSCPFKEAGCRYKVQSSVTLEALKMRINPTSFLFRPSL